MQDLYAEESESETAFCTLSAINVGKVDFDEYEHIAEVALRAVDKMIDKAPMMTASMKNSIMITIFYIGKNKTIYGYHQFTTAILAVAVSVPSEFVINTK